MRCSGEFRILSRRRVAHLFPRGSAGASGVAGGWCARPSFFVVPRFQSAFELVVRHFFRPVCALFACTEEEVMRYRPLGSDPADPRLGRFVPDDWRHVERYPLTALSEADRPTRAPVVIGVNWYSAF